jgi:hypothetical protein
MIPCHLHDWFARGTQILADETEDVALENAKIAVEIVKDIRNWGDDIIPAIYVPDGVSSTPANYHGRVIIVIYRYGVLAHARLGSIIFESGQAIVNINPYPTDENVSQGGEDQVGTFDLSDPDFPMSIFRPFQSAIPKNQQ